MRCEFSANFRDFGGEKFFLRVFLVAEFLRIFVAKTGEIFGLWFCLAFFCTRFLFGVNFLALFLKSAVCGRNARTRYDCYKNLEGAPFCHCERV